MPGKLTKQAKVTTIENAAPDENLLIQVADRMMKVVEFTVDVETGNYVVTVKTSDGDTYNVMVRPNWLVVRVPQFIYNQWVG